jgi:hypothetical protein
LISIFTLDSTHTYEMVRKLFGGCHSLIYDSLEYSYLTC